MSQLMRTGSLALNPLCQAFCPIPPSRTGWSWLDVDHDLARRIVAFERAIGVVDRRQREMPGIDARRDLAGSDQPGRLAQDLALVGTAFARQHRQQSEHA